MKKKITITTSAKDAQKILSELCIDDQIELSVFISGDSNKDICKKLSGIDEIIDWNFDNNCIENYKTYVNEPVKVLKDTKFTEEVIEKFNSSLNIDNPKVFNLDEILEALSELEINIPSNNELATLIEAIWKKGQTWSFGFGKNFIKGLPEVYSEIANSPSNLNHAMIGMILGSYYTGISIENAIKDTISKISTLWDSRKDYQGVTGLVYAMYKNNNPKNI